MADKKILNKTARVINLKLVVKGKRLNVMLIPGLNFIDGAVHTALKKVKFVKACVDNDDLDFAPKKVKDNTPKNTAKVNEVKDPGKPLGTGGDKPEEDGSEDEEYQEYLKSVTEDEEAMDYQEWSEFEEEEEDED